MLTTSIRNYGVDRIGANNKRWTNGQTTKGGRTDKHLKVDERTNRQTDGQTNSRTEGVLDFNIDFNIHVCLSLRRRLASAASSRPTSDFYHFHSSRSPVRPLLSEAQPSYVYSILKPHGQSYRSPVRPLLSEAKPSCVYSILKPPGHSFRSQSDHC